jgi:hypothetical protein
MHKHGSSAAATVTWRRLLSLSVAMGAVVALAVGGGSGALAASSPHVYAPRTTAATSIAGTWKLLPKAPVTGFPLQGTAVWTGQEMIIHGITSKGSVTFGYRPATGTWVRLANGPRPLSGLEASDVPVWTGSRMVIMGLTNGSYNPRSNSWRPITRLPIPDEAAVVAWTGKQAIIWGGVCCAGTSRDGAAYNPASNTWTNLPSAPLSVRRNASCTWTGRELVVAGGFTWGPGGAESPFRDAAAYTPAANKWRKIAPMPRPEFDATAVWDGHEILFIGGSRNEVAGPFARGLAYNPRTNRWWLLPAMTYPRRGFAAVWTGRQLLVWGGLTARQVPPPHGEAYTPATGKWTALPASPLRGRADPFAAWTGRQMIVWGGSGFTDGAVFTPAR